MALADFQFQHNGLVMGAGTAYRINRVAGLRELPQVRVSDLPRLKQHGAFPGLDVLEPRTVTFTVTVVGAGVADFEGRLAAFEAATVPTVSGAGVPLSYKLPGQGQRQVVGRTRQRTVILVPSYVKGFVGAGTSGGSGGTAETAAWQVCCADPRIYDDTPTATALAGSATVVNAGNFESRPVLTVYPSSASVTVSNDSMPGSFVRLAGSIPSPCVVDLAARTVTDGGGANRFDVVNSSTSWFVLAPGSNQLSVTGATVTVTSRSAWM